MKKLLLFLFVLLTGTAFSQIDTLWMRSIGNGNLPTWFGTSNTERGFAYGVIANNPRILVASRNTGTFVRIINALTGADVGTMNVTGVTGGTFTLNDLEVSSDGVVYGINLTTDAAGICKIYRWTNETDAPTVAFENTFGGAKRIGDNFTVIGSSADNSLKVLACDATNNRIFIFGTTNNGVALNVIDTVPLPAGTFGGSPSVDYAMVDNNTAIVITKSTGRSVQAWTLDGVLFTTVPGTQIATGSSITKLMQANDQAFLANYQYTNNSLRIVDTQGNLGDYFRTYTVTSGIGSNANANGTGDVAFRYYTENGENKVIAYVLATNNGIAAFRVSFPYFVNGRFHENYLPAANKQNGNNGFGPSIDVRKLNYYVTNNRLYIAMESRLDLSNGNGIVLFVNSSKLTGQGASTGTSLGGVTGGGHLFGASGNPNFKNDFETHLGFVINPGGASDTNIYLDAVRYTATTKTGQYIGSTKRDGAGSQGPATAGIFAANAITFAFDSAYGERRGFEISIPLSEIGNPGSTDKVMLFAAVVSNTAFFSNVTVPGNVTTGNPGFDANFGTLSGGPYHSTMLSTPVELVSFNASATGNTVNLTWVTLTEKNNRGFEIEKSKDGVSFEKIGFVTGNGTSLNKHEYAFNALVSNGKWYFRLRQIDFDGTVSYSPVVNTEVGLPAEFALMQNYPNPFNPETSITFSVADAGQTSLVVYNTLGEQVAVLFNAQAEAGSRHTVSFAAKNLASGLYFYTIKQGSQSVSRKMILNK